MKEDQAKPDDKQAAEPLARADNDSGAEQAETTRKKPKYEFKILPVDPKNNFDFEDVADK